MDLAAIIIAGLGFIVALISLGFSIYSFGKSNKLAKENTLLANGMLELEIRNTIRDENKKLSDISADVDAHLEKEKRAGLNPEEKAKMDSLLRQWEAAKQAMLNAYEEGCSKYLDSKVDKTRFKRLYVYEIRNILENQNLKKYFDPHTSRYKAILKVYEEWENLEK